MAGRLKNGMVQIYTGDGKGKTTAAFGLAVRAAGAGLKVYIAQFIKGRPYSENFAISRIANITLRQCGRGCFVKARPGPKDIECARIGLEESARAINSGRYDVVILDEINIAAKIGLIKTSQITGILKNRPAGVEIVLTGRGCPRALYGYADLITCMKKVMHPYDKGVKARRGIEY